MVNKIVLEQFRNMEVFCFQTFSEGVNREWGTMFFNKEILQRHDANHAEITNPMNLNEIIPEIEEFYRSKHIPIRINYYDPSNDTFFKNNLRENNFTCLDNNNSVIFMKLENKIEFDEILSAPDNYRVSFCPAIITESQIVKDIESVIHSDWEYQNIVSNNNYYYFILYDLSIPVSVLSFFLYEPYLLARLDDVVTIPEYRNKGYLTFLLKFACNWVQNNDFTPYLFVHSNNVYAKKAYDRVGFKEIFSCKEVCWVKD